MRMPRLNKESAQPDSILKKSLTTISDMNSSKRKLAIFQIHKVVNETIISLKILKLRTVDTHASTEDLTESGQNFSTRINK